MSGASQAALPNTVGSAGVTVEEVPEFLLLLERLPVDVLSTLTEAQRHAIAVVMAMSARQHRVDYRVSVKWLRRRYYVRLMIGDEMRKLSRLRREHQLNLAPTLTLVLFIVWLLMSVLVAVGGVALYLMKCAFGIDLFDGPSFLHYCFFS